MRVLSLRREVNVVRQFTQFQKAVLSGEGCSHSLTLNKLKNKIMYVVHKKPCRCLFYHKFSKFNFD